MSRSGRDDGHTLTAAVQADRLDLPAVLVRVTPPRGRAVGATLGIAPLVVGSDPSCDLCVEDSRVSRRHAELRISPRGVVLRDLESKNGLLVGGVAVLEALLPPGVEVTLGSSRLVWVVGAGPRAIALSRAARFGDAVGGSVAMRALFAELTRAAASEETILLLGESGTGKELLARGIHANSPRSEGPFVVLDCSAIAPGVVESELFGHTKGAFTDASAARPGLLEQAHGGTLFIDEIGELPLDVQPKLLRALESRTFRRVGANEQRPFDARIVAATHRDLRTRAAEGSFRQDLYYRLAVVEVTIPPLRERREDISLLVDRILAGMTPPRSWADLPPNSVELLTAHDWPGNVRELRNVVARLVLFPDAARRSLRAEGPERGASLPIAAVAGLPLREARDVVVEQFERAYLSLKLAEHAGNVSRTAETIGVSRQFLHRLLERYGLRGADRGPEA